MDLTQQKLSRTEWNGIEIPVSDREKQILTMILQGYMDLTIEKCNCSTIRDIVKTDNTTEMEYYLFTLFLQENCMKDIHKYKLDYTIEGSKSSIKKKDQIRIDNFKSNVDKNAYEFVIQKLIHGLLTTDKKKKKNKYYYSLYYLTMLPVTTKNEYMDKYAKYILEKYKPKSNEIQDFVFNAIEWIEQNPYVYGYETLKLYDHQKRLFQLFSRDSQQGKMILYIAPTGTGKTMSPIGLSQGKRVIFVCAARHVGLALAKSAVSVGKKIAFAFGCETPEDIRLHYFAVKECTRDKRTGTIRKVNNSIGDLVEIMICDIKSYISAMSYMLAFNKATDMVLYWDEPTISLDYNDHPLHEIIKTVWSENVIPNIVLSSATLPKEHEITVTIAGYKDKFPDAEVITITSSECKKTIPILNKSNEIEMPHYLYSEYDDMRSSITHCQENKTMYRYLDLADVINVIQLVNIYDEWLPERYRLNEYFDTIDGVTIENIKTYYLTMMYNISKLHWDNIYQYLCSERKALYESTIYMATKDAHTLTHGPTIYLTDDIHKITSFCLQTIQLPPRVLDELRDNLIKNNRQLDKIIQMEQDMEDMLKKDEGKENKLNAGRIDPSVREKMKEIEKQKKLLKAIMLDDVFVPNTKDHFHKWTSNLTYKGQYTSSIDSKTIERILNVSGINDGWKVLLMMGIGVFCKHDNQEYVDIMKELAETQSLYMIIASTDYIYGTNYQFCHAYIGKDLEGSTQEKMIQAMGRVGRGAFQHVYSLRFRNDDLIHKIFQPELDKKEVFNMNRLFV